MLAYSLLAMTILLTGLSQLLQKGHAISSGRTVVFLSMTFRWSHQLLWAVITLACAMVCWILTLSQMPLSVAYPLLSLNFILVVWAGHRFFHESVSIQQAFGLLLIVCGVVILNG